MCMKHINTRIQFLPLTHSFLSQFYNYLKHRKSTFKTRPERMTPIRIKFLSPSTTTSSIDPLKTMKLLRAILVAYSRASAAEVWTQWSVQIAPPKRGRLARKPGTSRATTQWLLRLVTPMTEMVWPGPVADQKWTEYWSTRTSNCNTNDFFIGNLSLSLSPRPLFNGWNLISFSSVKEQRNILSAEAWL